MITLRPYQIEAADNLEAILREKRIAYLAGQVRTGKSLTVLSLQQRFKHGGHILVLTAKKAIASIQKDARDLLGDDAQYVTVTNYEQVPNLERRSWMMVVCDEAHRLAAYPKPSKRLKDVRTLNAALWVLMSGTPSPESYSQLYHQYAVGNGPWRAYKNFYAWAKDYVIIGQQYVGTGQKVNTYHNAIEAKVLRDIEPYTVRVTQEDAGFETTIEERVHMVKMLPRTYRIAHRVMRDGVVGNPKGRAIVADSGAKMQGKIHQIASGTVRLERNGVIHTTIFDRTKAKYIKDTFKGKKIAVLYKYDAQGVMLREVLSNTVDTPEAFNADPTATFVGQVQSSREGVNLSTADELVFFTVDFASLSYSQAKDRASYLGRTRTNIVNWIFAEGLIEPSIYATVLGKQDYTLKHFNRDRITISIEAHQVL